MRRLFIAGSHTDVGKTYVACALIEAARARRLGVRALKPLISGYAPETRMNTDTGRLLTALGSLVTDWNVEQVSPWRYLAALSPPMAARLEGKIVDLDEVAAWCQARLARDNYDLMLVEGAGGVMSPLSDEATNLDLIAALGAPCLLVGGAYLGAISHTLTAAETMRAWGCPPVATVVSESADPDAPDFAETVTTVARFMRGSPVFAAPRNGDVVWAEAVLDLIRPGEEA